MTTLTISLLLTLAFTDQEQPPVLHCLSILHTEPSKAMNQYRILFPSRLINGPNSSLARYVPCRNHLHPSILQRTTTTCDHYYPREGVRKLSMWRHGSVVHSQGSIDCDRDTEKLGLFTHFITGRAFYFCLFLSVLHSFTTCLLIIHGPSWPTTVL